MEDTDAIWPLGLIQTSSTNYSFYKPPMRPSCNYELRPLALLNVKTEPPNSPVTLQKVQTALSATPQTVSESLVQNPWSLMRVWRAYGGL